MKRKKKCKGHMEVTDNGFGTGTVWTKCNKCGATDCFSTATRHYYDGCITNDN